jgi:predicted permease
LVVCDIFMFQVFSTAFGGTLTALLPIVLVIVAGGLLVRKGLLTDDHISGLSTATVVLFLPCLIFSKIVSTFDPGVLPLWWLLPLAAVLMPMVGLALGSLVFLPHVRQKRNLLPLAAMQNAGYLVLPVGLALEPERFDVFAVYCFLFILGFNPVLWSVGKLLATDDRQGNGWRGVLTPPLIANVVAVTAVFTGLADSIPATVLDAVDLVGQAAVPVATVILGAVLGTVHLDLRRHLADALRVLVVKYAALPTLVIVALLILGVHETNPLLARFFVLEASAAPAAGIILQVRAYGGDEETIGTLTFIAYAACVVSMPLWLSLWELVR